MILISGAGPSNHVDGYAHHHQIIFDDGAGASHWQMIQNGGVGAMSQSVI